MKIAISTDTTSTISLDLAKKLGIYVFPLNVIINGEEFLDGVSITPSKLSEEMKAGKVIKTSTPPPMSVITYFEEIFNEGYDYVIHFTISSKLSSMNTLFNNMSAEHFDNKVIVIDSYSLSIVQLSQVLYAYEEVNKGTSIDVIKEKLNERKEDYLVNFVPENLTALKNGGRISPAIAALGNMIGLKPVLALIDGALDKEAMTRNVRKAFAENITKNVETRPVDKYDYIVVSFEGNEELVNYLVKEINKSFPDYRVPVLPVAINVCAHCGPGTVGVLIVPRINEHSLNYYLDM